MRTPETAQSRPGASAPKQKPLSQRVCESGFFCAPTARYESAMMTGVPATYSSFQVT